uniref:Predicted protein n=1 Tax=Hordeum vulgare subsp. vulgare TaxID=112509 RepID=F2ECZ5_HORVV|nr:predicted protein [Hordeum vulgare subsp. vulgare]
MVSAVDGAGNWRGGRWGLEGTRETEPVVDPCSVDARDAERWEAPATTVHSGNGEDVAADDDSWCDASDSPGCDSSLHREWTHRQDHFHKMGYRDGVTEGQKDVAQGGFNLGHRQSAHVGYKWGLVRGITSALASLSDSLKEKLLLDPQRRGKLEDLHNSVKEISALGALQLFHESTLQDNRRPEESELQTITKDLLLLLHECPDVHVSEELKRVP